MSAKLRTGTPKPQTPCGTVLTPCEKMLTIRGELDVSFQLLSIQQSRSAVTTQNKSRRSNVPVQSVLITIVQHTRLITKPCPASSDTHMIPQSAARRVISASSPEAVLNQGSFNHCQLSAPKLMNGFIARTNPSHAASCRQWSARRPPEPTIPSYIGWSTWLMTP